MKLSLCLLLPLAGCASAAKGARPATYEAELVACNQIARSLYESIACENEARKRYGRPLRAFPDGGAP